MQNAKDTFYITLRERLAAINASRTLYLRGVTRPGILVEENEIPTVQAPSDVFVLRWIGVDTSSNFPLTFVKLQCELEYATEGTEKNLAMDRGVLLTEMDREVASILQPYETQKMNYSQTPPTARDTQIFWTEALFQPVKQVRERLSRVAVLTVFSYEEPGEL
jgi:hypothetical protein